MPAGGAWSDIVDDAEKKFGQLEGALSEAVDAASPLLAAMLGSPCETLDVATGAIDGLAALVAETAGEGAASKYFARHASAALANRISNCIGLCEGPQVKDAAQTPVVKWILQIPSPSRLQQVVRQKRTTLPILLLLVGFTDMPQFWLQVDDRSDPTIGRIWTRHSSWSKTAFYQTLVDEDAIVLAPVWNGLDGNLDILQAARAVRDGPMTWPSTQTSFGGSEDVPKYPRDWNRPFPSLPESRNNPQRFSKGASSLPHWTQWGMWGRGDKADAMLANAPVEIWQRNDIGTGSTLVYRAKRGQSSSEAPTQQVSEKGNPQRDVMDADMYAALSQLAATSMNPNKAVLAAHSMGGFIATQIFATNALPTLTGGRISATPFKNVLLMSTGAAVETPGATVDLANAPINPLASRLANILGDTNFTTHLAAWLKSLQPGANKVSENYVANEGAGAMCWILHGNTQGAASDLAGKNKVHVVHGTSDEYIPYRQKAANLWWGSYDGTGAPTPPGSGVATTRITGKTNAGFPAALTASVIAGATHTSVVDDSFTLQLLREMLSDT